MKVGLALGGGGARGFAHIGVMRAIEERSIEPVAVAGCSMGGIIGAFVANKIPSDQIRAAFADLKAINLFDWSNRTAINGGRGLEKQIQQHLPHRFDELKLPFRTTAVDIQEGSVYVFSEGVLVPALRATSAVPGMFSPVEHDGRMLVDGGLLSNVPIEEVRSMTTQPIIAVDVTPPANRALAFEGTHLFLQRLHALRSGQRPLFVDLLTKAYEIPAAVLNDMRVAALRPQIYIKPALPRDLKPEDFKRMDEAIEAGYKAAVKVLDTLATAS